MSDGKTTGNERTPDLTIDNKPRVLSDIVGQEHITKSLRNMSKTMQFPQAMMFAGSSGTGKTTMAHIVSALLGCKAPRKVRGGSKEPCGECSSCKSVFEGKFTGNYYRYSGKDLTKDVVEKIEEQCCTMSAGNKIFIIDEAQGIVSSSAKNAMLDILEKKWNNVKFILMTMEPQSLKNALKDRCTFFWTKKIMFKEMLEALTKILDSIDPEGKIPMEFMEVLAWIARNSNGSLRKAIKELEFCITSESFTLQVAQEALLGLSEDTMYTILSMFAQKDSDAFSALEKHDITDFFRYSWAILLNIQKYSLIGSYPTDWQEKRAKEIETPSFSDLCETYMNIKRDNSFGDKNVFLHHMYTYYRKESKNSERKMRG